MVDKNDLKSIPRTSNSATGTCSPKLLHNPSSHVSKWVEISYVLIKNVIPQVSHWAMDDFNSN